MSCEVLSHRFGGTVGPRATMYRPLNRLHTRPRDPRSDPNRWVEIRRPLADPAVFGEDWVPESRTSGRVRRTSLLSGVSVRSLQVRVACSQHGWRRVSSNPRRVTGSRRLRPGLGSPPLVMGGELHPPLQWNVPPVLWPSPPLPREGWYTPEEARSKDSQLTPDSPSSSSCARVPECPSLSVTPVTALLVVSRPPLPGPRT